MTLDSMQICGDFRGTILPAGVVRIGQQTSPLSIREVSPVGRIMVIRGVRRPAPFSTRPPG